MANNHPEYRAQIDITICGVRELPDQGGKPWTHVISIWDSALRYDKSCREQVKLVAPGAELLFCFFGDTTVPTHPEAPLGKDVRRILDFTKQLPVKAKVLVHCYAGISRSTAIAYAILCQRSPPGMELENLMHIQSLRSLAYPNRLIVQYADQILVRKGAMLLHLRRDS